MPFIYEHVHGARRLMGEHRREEILLGEVEQGVDHEGKGNHL